MIYITGELLKLTEEINRLQRERSKKVSKLRRLQFRIDQLAEKISFTVAGSKENYSLTQKKIRAQSRLRQIRNEIFGTDGKLGLDEKIGKLMSDLEEQGSSKDAGQNENAKNNSPSFSFTSP